MFPKKDNLASANHDNIICVFESPLPAASTSRLSNVLKFKENLFEFDLCSVQFCHKCINLELSLLDFYIAKNIL